MLHKILEKPNFVPIIQTKITQDTFIASGFALAKIELIMLVQVARPV